MTTFTRVCFPIKDHPWPALRYDVREVVRENRYCYCYISLFVAGRCGGVGGTDVLPKKCHYLNPELGTWDQMDMENERQRVKYMRKLSISIETRGWANMSSVKS